MSPSHGEPPALDDPGFAPRRILIRAPNPLGDAVLSEPAARALRARFPGARIDVLLAELNHAVGEAWPFVDGVMALPLGAGLGKRLGRLRLLGRTLTAGYDLVVLFTNSRSSARLAWLARPGRILGYARDGRERYLTDIVPFEPAFDHEPMVAFYGRLAAAAGGRLNPASPELHPSRATHQAARRLLDAAGLTGRRFVALAPGAAFGPAKRWPAAHYGALARRAIDELGLAAVLLGNPDERALGDAVAAAAGRRSADLLNLVGRTDAAMLIGLIAAAAGFVGNDSGAAHVAAALGIAGIVIFGSSNPARSGPASRQLRVLRRDLPCSPCLARDCPLGHLDCLRTVSADEAFAALRDALAASAVS
jgi:heptosyltransferase-2